MQHLSQQLTGDFLISKVPVYTDIIKVFKAVLQRRHHRIQYTLLCLRGTIHRKESSQNSWHFAKPMSIFIKELFWYQPKAWKALFTFFQALFNGIHMQSDFGHCIHRHHFQSIAFICNHIQTLAFTVNHLHSQAFTRSLVINFIY